jgi:hypothetical protein
MFYEILLLVVAILVAMALVYAFYPANVYELFTDFVENEGYPTEQLREMPLSTPLPQLSGPADATLETPRSPYNLLSDHLAPAEGKLTNLKSDCAYVGEDKRNIKLTGSYDQITNNYKKDRPDNGSTLTKELSLSFYK